MKGKRLYYIPGLFSIIGLPILLLLIGPGDPDRHTAMSVQLPSDAEHSPLTFNRDGWFAFIKNKKVETIDLDYPSFSYYYENDDVLSAQRFRFVTAEIERLVFTHDTSTVLKVDLGENNSYGDFVWLYNHMAFYKLQHYAFVDNSLYILSNRPSPHYHTEPLVIEEVDLKDFLSPPTWWQAFKRHVFVQIRETGWLIGVYWKHNSLLIPGFFLLILVPSLLRIRKRWVNP